MKTSFLVGGSWLGTISPSWIRTAPKTTYPNGGEYRNIAVQLHNDAVICGQFSRNDGVVKEACGGPAVGLPYFVATKAKDGFLRFEVIDVFGNRVLKTGTVPDTCVTRASAGCTICSDEDGRVISNGCAQADYVSGDNTCFAIGAQSFVGVRQRQVVTTRTS